MKLKLWQRIFIFTVFIIALFWTYWGMVNGSDETVRDSARFYFNIIVGAGVALILARMLNIIKIKK